MAPDYAYKLHLGNSRVSLIGWSLYIDDVTVASTANKWINHHKYHQLYEMVCKNGNAILWINNGTKKHFYLGRSPEFVHREIEEEHFALGNKCWAKWSQVYFPFSSKKIKTHCIFLKIHVPFMTLGNQNVPFSDNDLQCIFSYTPDYSHSYLEGNYNGCRLNGNLPRHN